MTDILKNHLKTGIVYILIRIYIMPVFKIKKVKTIPLANKTRNKIPLPRHKEINEYTAKGILEDAGLK